MKKYDAKESGARVKALRKQRGLTQAELAEKLRISLNSVSRIELGTMGCSVDLFVQLSVIFQVSLDYLILGEEPPVASPQSRIDEVIRQLVSIRDSMK